MSVHGIRVTWRLLVLFAVLCTGPVSAWSRVTQQIPGDAGQQSIAVRTIEGLRQRRLFEMANQYAMQATQETRSGSRQQVEIVVALLQTLGEKAYQSAKEDDWKTARQTADEWRNRIQSPRKILVDVQAVLIQQLRVERWVREIETDAATGDIRQRGLVAATKLVAQYDPLQRDALALLNRRPGPREQADWFSPDELLTLRYNLDYQKARALSMQASFYSDSDESSQIEILSRVQQQLESVTLSVGPDQTLWWNVQADLLDTARRLGNYRLASRIYSSTTTKPTTIVNRNLVKGRWIRALTSQRRFDDAISIAGKTIFSSATPDLDLARVQLFVALAKETREPAWEQRALKLTSEIENNHGGYWGRLANLAVVGAARIGNDNPTAENDGGGGSLDLLIRVADEAQRKERWPEALKALDTAFSNALASKQIDSAWKLGFRAAAIQQEQQQFDAAARRFESLARQLQNHPQAPTAKLMACWNLTRIVAGDPKNEAALQRYDASLQQLLDQWPASTSADQARVWLASLRQAEKNWPSMIGLLLDVRSDSETFAAAVSKLRDGIAQTAIDSQVSDDTRQTIVAAVMSRLAPLIQSTDANGASKWSPVQFDIALLVAELHLVHRAEWSADQEANVVSALNKVTSDANADRRQRDLGLALSFLASGKKFPLSENAAVAQGQLDRILQGSIPLRGDSGKPDRLCSAYEFFATAIGRLPGPDQRRFLVATIDGMLSLNRVDDAITLASQAARKFPKDAVIQIGLANALNKKFETSKQQADAVQALQQWRKVTASSRKNSASWFQGKFEVCRLLAETGDNAAALQRLNFIKAIPPGWKNSSLSGKFDELYRSIGGR